MQIASSPCAPSLRIIDAEVSYNAVEAIQAICQACPNLRSLHLRDCSADIDGDEIIETVVQHCPLIEALPTSCELTDTAFNALANIHTLKELQVSAGDCSSEAVQRVVRANPHLTLVRIKMPIVDDALVRCIGDYSGNVTSLNLLQAGGTPSQSINTVSNHARLDLFPGCPQLKFFYLSKPGGMPR